jgi:hypothetical protein
MIQNLDPRIGYLASGTFYAYVGPDRREVMGTREEVEDALGLAPTVAPIATPLASSINVCARRVMRDYVVSVRPKFPSWNVQPYEVTIAAYDREDAIGQARGEYRECSQWTNGAATYRAKLA